MENGNDHKRHEQSGRPVLALFDFDGTLTTKDTFIEFARHTVGRRRLILGILRNALWLTLWKLRIIDGGTAKEHLFSTLYRGMSREEFRRYGESFAVRIKEIERREIVDRLDRHIKAGDRVYIISASIADWIVAWAADHGLPPENVIATEAAADPAGILTGRFSTPNCHGPEKVARLRKRLTDPERYEIYAYGDSAGDRAMLALADHPVKVG